MTLIAAVRCEDGFAIAADSQETDGDYRRTVQKLTPIEFGNCRAVIAGAGNGDLVQNFIAFLKTNLPSIAPEDITQFVNGVETVLQEFYRTDVPLSPPDNRDLQILLAASIITTGEYGAWIARNTFRLYPVDTSVLLGWEEKLYYRSLEKISTPGMPLAHAVLLAIHTLTVAEETSNYVRGPMSVSVVSKRGIFEEPARDVRAVTDRLKEYEDQINKLFLLYSDVTTSSTKFKEQLEEFSRSAIALRETHVEAEIRRLFADGFDTSGWPYQKFPKGVGITLSNSGVLEVIQGELREEMRRIAWKHSPEGQGTPSEPPESKKPEDPVT